MTLARRARSRSRPVVLLAAATLWAATACSAGSAVSTGSTTPPAQGPGGVTGASSAAAAPVARPGCPLTADAVSSTLEKPVRQQGTDCIFAADDGTVTLAVEEHPREGPQAYARAREQARQKFGGVVDISRERTEFFANGDGAGQATAVVDDRLYTISVQGFGFDADAYQTVALQLITMVLG